MSQVTIADLSYITREDLSGHLLSDPSEPALPSSMAIVDVRDSDHIGGHIKGSTHVPSSQLDYRMPELVRTLKDKETVVFHCALSQQRGPSAALRYLRERGRLLEVGERDSEGDKKTGSEKEGEATQDAKKAQKVVVLDGGFVKWQEEYGEDKRLTEAYEKSIWEFGY